MSKYTKEYLESIKPDSGQRWEQGIDHDPRSEELFEFISRYNFYCESDSFCWKKGGDGDNGEILMYVYFSEKDKEFK